MLSLPDSFAEGGVAGGVAGGTDESESVPVMGDAERGIGVLGDFNGTWNRGSMGSGVVSVVRFEPEGGGAPPTSSSNTSCSRGSGEGARFLDEGDMGPEITGVVSVADCPEPRLSS
jgi:hypothetical protein